MQCDERVMSVQGAGGVGSSGAQSYTQAAAGPQQAHQTRNREIRVQVQAATLTLWK